MLCWICIDVEGLESHVLICLCGHREDLYKVFIYHLVGMKAQAPFSALPQWHLGHYTTAWPVWALNLGFYLFDCLVVFTKSY